MIVASSVSGSDDGKFPAFHVESFPFLVMFGVVTIGEDGIVELGDVGCTVVEVVELLWSEMCQVRFMSQLRIMIYE